MTDQALRHTDELLSELVELVETARTLPMSSSCILPRERVLDLLDELRETMPPEMVEARRVIAAREALLREAHDEGVQVREDATRQADQLVYDAEVRVHEIVEAARVERDQLVSASGVHQAATAESRALRQAAEEYDTTTRAEADQYAAQTRADADEYAETTRAEADRYAAKLEADADDYADRTLAELIATLNRSAATAEQGRTAIAQRRSQPISD